MKPRSTFYLTFCLIFFLSNACTYKNTTPFRVWVLHSYQEDCPWMEDLNRGIRDGFKKEHVKVELTFNYLHSNYTLERCRDSVKALLDRAETPDLILSVNDQATLALLEINHPLAQESNGSKIVFCGIDYPDALPLGAGKSNYWGYSTRIDFEANRVFANLQGMRKMYLFVKPDTLCSIALREIRRQAKSANSAVPFTIDTLTAKNYHDVYYKTIQERYNYFNILLEWDCYISEFIKTSSTPFIALSNEGFGTGCLGGCFTPSYNQTLDGARMAAAILLYKNVPNRLIHESKKYTIVDWEVLERFNLPISNLPNDTHFIHMPFQIRYKNELMIALIVGVILATLFIVFFIYKIHSYGVRKKKAEATLKQQRDSLQVITDSITEGIVSVDSQSRIVSFNAQARELLQWKGPEADYIGTPLSEWIEIVDVSTPHSLAPLLQTAIQENQTVRLSPFATIQNKKTNHYFLAEGEFTTLYQDTYANGAVFSFTDRTEEFTTQEYLSLTAASGQLFFWWYDFGRAQFIIDPAFFTQFDLPDDGTHALPLSVLLDSFHPDDLAAWQEMYAHQRFDQVISTRQEARININGKGEQWWEVRLTYQQNNRNEMQPIFYGLCINIQNYKEKQALLEEARENVRRSDQLKSAFLSNMSHEIRTPLNGIIGFARLIASNESFDPEEHKLFVETIQTNCNLMLVLLNDILDLARIDSGNMTYNDADCDLNELINQIMTTQQVIMQKPIRLVARLPETPIHLEIDKFRLNQVITNLVNNAVKFTSQGSITIGYDATSEEIRIHVKDTGIGIPREDLPKIFNRFYKKHNDIQGAGIGLNLCQNIIHHYGGRIEVDSEEGKGTTFTVILPRKRPSEEVPD